MAGIEVYLETGSRRAFAGAVDWPGWCRSGRDPDSALKALAEYGKRYRNALRSAARGFSAPKDSSDLDVVQRLEGNATTDFGAPGLIPRADRRPLDEPDAKRLAAILRASWRAFDRAAAAAVGATLAKGPRGGGRELGAIVEHVLGAEEAYLARLGGVYRAPARADAAVDVRMAGVRKAFLDVFSTRARGEPAPRTPRSGKLWTPRYAVRRSAWHALDHAWEIEDRAE